MKRWAVGIGIAVALYTILGFVVLPAIIKSQILKRLPALTHRRVAVQEVKLNPYALSFTLRGLSLTETNGDEFASLGELYVNFQSISLLKWGFVFREIRLVRPSTKIVLLANGTFNFSNLLTSEGPPAARQSPPQRLPLVVIDALKIQDGRFDFTDLSQKKPFHQRVGPINVRLTNFTTRPKEGSSYSITVTTDDGETIAWSGDLTVSPPHSAGTFQLAGLQIKKYAVYLEDAAPVRILGGRVNVRTDYRVDLTGGSASLAVSNLVLDLDGLEAMATQPRPARANIDKLRLSISGVTFDSTSRNLAVAEIRLAGLESGVTLLPGTAATQTVVQASVPATSVTREPATPTGNFQVQIGEIALDNASFHFADDSINPHVESSVGQFTGTMKGLSSDINSVAAVSFKGKVNNYAPFWISGKINPLASNLFVDVAISLKQDALKPDSPYAAKYVGYPVDNGALSLDLRYYVSQGELKSENKVRVDQLQLGEASNSPDAIKLPVKLGIAVLQDRHGVIALDLPVNGRLDDPKFKLGPVIMQVFMNVMTKAMTKPFALLGSVFGGGEDLNHIAFEPGTADFVPGEAVKLDTLATALYERPQLKLGIIGSIDPVADRAALARQKLDRKLVELRAKELEASGQKVTSVDAVRLTPEDRQRLLKLAYAEAMGLVNPRASSARAAAVVAHLTTRQNFEPLRKAETAQQTNTPSTSQTPSLADMEAKLIEVADVTPADFTKLMEHRAAAVRAYLLQSGKVEPERITIAAPKPVNTSSPGASRVDLTLE